MINNVMNNISNFDKSMKNEQTQTEELPTITELKQCFDDLTWMIAATERAKKRMANQQYESK